MLVFLRFSQHPAQARPVYASMLHGEGVRIFTPGLQAYPANVSPSNVKLERLTFPPPSESEGNPELRQPSVGSKDVAANFTSYFEKRV